MIARPAAPASSRLAAFARAQLFADEADFTRPDGDPGVFGPASVTWRVHANPVALAIGGVAAVILQLAEPRVRTGVWEHSNFRSDPLGRMRRTAAAAMLVTYGPTAAVDERIAAVNRMHARVAGATPQGQPYAATDAELLDWVQLTTNHGFLNAHRAYVEPRMSAADQDRYYHEAAAIGARFGARDLPLTAAEANRRLIAMRPQLQPHPIVHEFLGLVAVASPLGWLGRPLQPALIDAAVALLPAWAAADLGIRRPALRTAASQRILSALAGAAERLPNQIVQQAHARARG